VLKSHLGINSKERSGAIALRSLGKHRHSNPTIQTGRPGQKGALHSRFAGIQWNGGVTPRIGKRLNLTLQRTTIQIPWSKLIIAYII
jgi:hypothetical protein